MPNPSDFNSQSEWMGACVPKMMQDKGMAQDQAVAACMNMWKNENEGASDTSNDTAAEKRDISYQERKDLKDSDFVYPETRSFPIVKPEDVMAAVHSFGRSGHNDFADFKRRLTALAKRKGFEAQLPEEWKQAAKFELYAVKAMSDGMLDVNAAPFRKDTDLQDFGDDTDFMLSEFPSPAIIYHHGVMPGKQTLQPKPVIIGKSLWASKESDGLHLGVQLNMALEWGRRVWEAAKAGNAVASSDSIAHLARLDVGGRRIMYEKGRPGHIAVWPLAGVSLWDKVPGNFNPASKYALALPAVKAIYRDAGLAFPELDGTYGDLHYADETAARRAEILAKARKLLAKKP